MRKIMIVVSLGVGVLLAGCSLMKNDNKERSDALISGQLSSRNEILHPGTVHTGNIVETKTSPNFSYNNLNIHKTYYFTLDSKTNNYVADIPELHVKITIPPIHPYREDNNAGNEYFKVSLASGLRVDNNVIDNQIAIYDKKADEDILDTLNKAYKVNMNIPECAFSSGVIMRNDKDFLRGDNILFYSVDGVAFEKSSHALKGEFGGGIDQVCGHYASDYTRIYYTPDHPDRYMQSMTSPQSVELLNGGTYIEYTD